jgi:hypothetical protein
VKTPHGVSLEAMRLVVIQGNIIKILNTMEQTMEKIIKKTSNVRELFILSQIDEESFVFS